MLFSKLIILSLSLASSVFVLSSVADKSLTHAEIARTTVSREEQVKLWQYVYEDLEQLFPLVDCSMEHNATAPAAVEDDNLRALEDGLRKMFPNIECRGTVALNTNLDHEYRHPNGTAIVSKRREIPNIGAEKNKNLADIQTESKKGIWSCADAPHPANCKACIIFWTNSGIATAAVCTGVAFASIKGITDASPKDLSRNIMVTLGLCYYKAVSDIAANSATCWHK